MSLLEEYMTNCILMNKVHQSDGIGGTTSVWTDGPEIKAAITFNSSMESRIAEKQGVTALYTITTNKSVNLQYHDVLRRIEDGKIFRVTSDGDDNKTPSSSTLNMRNVTAEEWELPADDGDE
jgi:head-tail adaptor